MSLDGVLETFFRDRAPLASGDVVLVAFSGGADSTALLTAICDHAGSRGIRVMAAHVDHGLDPASRERAEAAKKTATALGIHLVVSRQDVTPQKRRGESLEMAARRIRYRELERIATEVGARYIATAHHRDDQAETVLLRLAAGHGLSGLGAIPARRGAIVRPLLGQSRVDLLDLVRRRGLSWVEDPTNRDLSAPRNLVRHRLLPALEAETPGISNALARLARAARGANRRLSRTLERRLRPDREGSVITVSRRALERLAPVLLPHAIVYLLRCSGSHRRPSHRALAYLESLLTAGAPVGVDLGGGWRLEEARAGKLALLRTPERTPPFAYNLEVPGEVHIGELSSSLRLRAGRAEPWMFRGDRRRAGFSLPPETREQLTVRNRRPGDRVQPLGSSSPRKLKDLLIDHRIPKNERDRLPLLCHSDRILWVPGVTIDHEARIRNGSEIWVAEIIPDE